MVLQRHTIYAVRIWRGQLTMKLLQPLLIGFALLSAPVLSLAQAQDYSTFSTNDESNNIEVFKSTSPSVVNITNARLVRSAYSLNPQEVPQGTGTGFVWDKEGHIVTNYHVVQQADRVLVFDDGRVAEQGAHQELLRQGGLYGRLYGHLQAT